MKGKGWLLIAMVLAITAASIMLAACQRDQVQPEAQGLWATYHVFQTAAVTTTNGTAMNVKGIPAVGLQVTGITTATITFEMTGDGTNWEAVRAINLGTGTGATTTTADGVFLIPMGGQYQFRARISSWTAGTITVSGYGVTDGFYSSAGLMDSLEIVGELDAGSVTASYITATIQLSTDKFLTPYENTVTVAKSGGDFATIQGAIDSITDAAADKKYAILIYPGTYTENITGTNHVNLRGMGASPGQTTITAASGTVLTVQTGSNSQYENIAFAATGTAEVINVPVGANGKEIKFVRCVIKATYASRADDMVVINSGDVQFGRCTFKYIQTGAATVMVTHRAIRVAADSDAVGTYSSIISIDIDDTNANNFCFLRLDSGADCSVNLDASWYKIDTEITGTSSLFCDYDACGTEERNVWANHVDLCAAAGGTATAYVLDDVVTTARSMSNFLHLAGGTKYVASIGTAATLVSNFDEITGVTVESETTGAGTYSAVNSPADDIFAVTDDIHASYIEFDDASDTYIGLDKVYTDYFGFINNYTNFWLGYAADPNIWVNYDVDADVFFGHSGDTDIRIYSGTAYSTLDQGLADFTITNAATNGDIVLEANGTGGVKINTLLTEAANTGITLATTDFGKTITIDAAGTQTVTLPSVAATDLGAWFRVVKLGAGMVVIDAADSDTIADSGAGDTIYNSEAGEVYAVITLQLAATTKWVVTGAHGTWITTD